jgi:hypothetical protein
MIGAASPTCWVNASSTYVWAAPKDRFRAGGHLGIQLFGDLDLRLRDRLERPTSEPILARRVGAPRNAAGGHHRTNIRSRTVSVIWGIDHDIQSGERWRAPPASRPSHRFQDDDRHPMHVREEPGGMANDIANLEVAIATPPVNGIDGSGPEGATGRPSERGERGDDGCKGANCPATLGTHAEVSVAAPLRPFTRRGRSHTSGYAPRQS